MAVVSCFFALRNKGYPTQLATAGASSARRSSLEQTKESFATFPCHHCPKCKLAHEQSLLPRDRFVWHINYGVFLFFFSFFLWLLIQIYYVLKLHLGMIITLSMWIMDKELLIRGILLIWCLLELEHKQHLLPWNRFVWHMYQLSWFSFLFPYFHDCWSKSTIVSMNSYLID